MSLDSSSDSRQIKLRPITPGDLSHGNHGGHTVIHHSPITSKSSAGDPDAKLYDVGSSSLPWLNVSNWDNEPVPQREWAIRDRVPLKQVGLFSGEGGAGKSNIELMKDVAHATAKDWYDTLPEPGPAFYIGAEDSEEELHIRLAAIAGHYGVSFTDLITGQLKILCLLGRDATLCAVKNKSGKVETTALYKQIFEAAGDIKPKNISIDPLSRAFTGNELDRSQVYAFANHMQTLAIVANGSVTVLSHPSLAGIATGTGLSGSTAWHGAFRFRQYLVGVKSDDDGEQPEGDLRELRFKKNQYGPIGATIVLRYQRGLFLPEKKLSNIEMAAKAASAEEMLITIGKKLEARGAELSPSQTSHNYAPTVIAKEAEAKGMKKSALIAALNRLLDAGKLAVETLRTGTTREKRVIRFSQTSAEGDDG
jgi:RecA-family ATPase